MPTYVNNLRLTELNTGEGSGTWGTTTNTSLELIGEALGYNTQNCFSSDADATTTVADGATDPARALYFKVTSSATLTATRTLTVGPNTISRVMFIENATTGSQSINISQGSGANVTIATGKTAVVYLDGAGSGAAVVDAMAGVDPGVTDTLAEVLTAGNTTGGTSLVVSSGDDVTFTGASANIVFDSSDSALEFADNAKALFGAGSDLQIFHDGSNNFISSETGSLVIRAQADDNDVVINSDNGSGGTSNYFRADGSTGAAILYNYGSEKLATTSTGIDVTGVITTDGMTTSADINFGDNDKAIFGAGSDLEIFHNGTTNVIKSTTSNIELKVNGGGNFKVGDEFGNFMFAVNDNSDVQLYHGTTPALKLATTSTGVDVTGTVTADGLTVNSGTSDTVATFQSTDQFADLALTDSGGTCFIRQSNGSLILEADRANASSSSAALIKVDGSERMRIDSSGQVGIGTSSPAEELHISASVPKIQIQDSDGTNQYGQFYHSAGSTVIQARNNTSDGTIIFQKYDGTTTDETMRIDSSGNLLVGTTDNSPVGNNVAGVGLFPNGSGQLSRDGGTALLVNRKTSDGTLIDFRRDGTSHGVIGIAGQELFIAHDDSSTDSGLRFRDGGEIIPCQATGAGTNGVADLGSAGFKFKDLHLSGTVNADRLVLDSETITSSSNAATIDLSTGDNFVHDLTENVTYTFSNPGASGKISAFSLKVIQGSTARTITWPSSVDWAGGTAPTLSTANNAVDIFVFFTNDGGTIYYGFTAGQAMA